MLIYHRVFGFKKGYRLLMHVYNKSYMQIITSIKHIMLNKQYIYIMLLNNNYSNIYLYMLVSKSSTNG